MVSFDPVVAVGLVVPVGIGIGIGIDVVILRLPALQAKDTTGRA